MTAVDHLRAALDELDAEASELQHRLTEIVAMRVAIAPLIDGTGTVGHDAVTRTPTADAPPVKPAPPKASPVQPTERAKPRKAGGGSGRAHDYAEVARVAREAHVAGRNMADADVAPVVGPATPRRAEPPKAQPTPKASNAKPTTGRRRLHDLDKVARVAIEAHATNVSMRNAVADALGVTRDHAATLIKEARAAGHAIPKGTPGRPGGTSADADTLPAPQDRPRTTWTPKPGEMVLSCSDCDHLEPITGATALNRHCLANHRRTATVDERMPVRWDGAA